MHKKENNKESKTYVQGLRLFGNVIPHGLKGILKKNGYNYSEIIGKWNILVGKNIAKYCYPKSIKMSKMNTGGTLILAVKRGDEINTEYSKEEIMEKINSYFGYKLIRNIKIQIINSENKKIKIQNQYKKFSGKFAKKINEIKNEKIRNSLSQLFNAIKNDETKN